MTDPSKQRRWQDELKAMMAEAHRRDPAALREVIERVFRNTSRGQTEAAVQRSLSDKRAP